MNRMTRMLLLNGGRDKRKLGIEYEWPAQDRHTPTTYDQRPMEPRSAFYDDRGRRHYDDGRYAPMRSSMPMEPWADGRSDRRMERGDSPRMIGFGRDWDGEEMRSDATMPHYQEMDQMHGRRDQSGYASGTGLPRFDQRMAQEWTEGMKNADGTKGPHWSMDKVREIMREYQVDCDPVEFYAVLNSIYSDFCEALKENNTSNMKTYVCMAKAWLDDEDAVRDKAAAYFMYVVQR